MAKYTHINLKDKKSDILVLHCADPRFQKAYRETIDSFNKKYDLMERAGASKAAAQDSSTIDELKMLHGLHGFSTVHILDHIDCGAYGPVENEVEAHSHHLKLAVQKIKESVPGLNVVPHLLGEEQEIELPQNLTA